MKDDLRRRQYVPLSTTFAHGRTAANLTRKFGRDGLLVWVCYLAACKRAPLQGTFEYTSEPDGWQHLGLYGIEPEFTLDEFFRYTGRLHKTVRRTIGGRATNEPTSSHKRATIGLTTIECRGWADIQAGVDRELDNARKRRKRGTSKPDDSGTSNGQSEEDAQPRAREYDFEVEGETPPTPSPNGRNPEHRRRREPGRSDEPKTWTADDVHRRIVNWIESPAYDPETMDDTFVLDELVVAENRMHVSVTPEQRADLLVRAKARREASHDIEAA